MIIHSIVSDADIFCNIGECSENVEYRAVKGGLVELDTSGGRARVRRLISTDPALYLRREYSPYSTFKG